MLKWIVLFLTLVNIAVVAFYLWMENQSNALVSQYSPLNASKIVLLSATSTPATTSATTDNTGAALSNGDPICVEWRGMKDTDMDRSRQAVKKLAAQRVLSVEEFPEDRNFWVVFPPLPSEAVAKIKLNELSAMKIKDAYIVKDGTWKNGISLGLFETEDAARAYARELEDKGVSGLHVEPKPKQGSGYYYVVKSQDATTLRALDEIRVAFPSTTLVRVACKK